MPARAFLGGQFASGCAAALAAVAVLVGAAATDAVAEPATAVRVDDLAWLAGDWRCSIGDGEEAHEVWSAPAGGAMIGMFRWVSTEGVKLYEFFSLSLQDGAPVLLLRHFSPRLVGWESERDGPLVFRLVSHGRREATFEGREGDATVRLTYRRISDDELVAVVGEAGGALTFNYRLHR